MKTDPPITGTAPSRPWFDNVRALLGYQFPRLGPWAFKAFFALAPRHNCVNLFPKIRVCMDFKDVTQRTTYWQGRRFERPTPEILRNWLGHPQCNAFFDIGANYGFYSYMALDSSPHPVYAFDPHPDNYRHMLETKDRNHLENFHPQHLGLSDQPGALPLLHGIADRGHSTFMGNHPLQAEGARQTVATVIPFDQWLASHKGTLPIADGPRWVAKIDVEGYELKVVRGMEESLRQRRFLGVSIEVNPYTLGLAGTHVQELLDTMAGFGYRPMLPPHRQCNRQTPNVFFVPAPQE